MLRSRARIGSSPFNKIVAASVLQTGFFEKIDRLASRKGLVGSGHRGGLDWCHSGRIPSTLADFEPKPIPGSRHDEPSACASAFRS